MKNFTIGYSIHHPEEIEKAITDFKQNISDIYCAWPNWYSGRITISEQHKQKLINDLQKYSLMGLKFNVLFNSTYYPGIHTKQFFKKFDKTIEEIINSNIALQSITCVSPIIARFVKRTYDNFKVIASVNCHWYTPQQFQQVKDIFDAFYLPRQHNRNFNMIKCFRKWADDHGKQLYLLANSGCMKYCANTINHQLEITQYDEQRTIFVDDKYTFQDDILPCVQYNIKYPLLFLANSSFIQPEHISLYYDYFDKIKIASRGSNIPYENIKAYISQSYKGNLLQILQPIHFDLNNGMPLLNEHIDKNWYLSTLDCSGKCYECKNCINAMKKIINKYNNKGK